MMYYKNEFPEIKEVVFVKINDYSENVIYCSLIEYGNIEGILTDSEIDMKFFQKKMDRFLSDSDIKKKLFNVKKKYFSQSKIYPMMVIDINFNDNIIDLSHKAIKPEDRDKYIKQFHYMTLIYKLTEEFSKISKIMMSELLPHTMWKLISKNELENSQRKFTKLLEKPHEFISHTKEIYPSESNDFLDNFVSRITCTTCIIHQLFSLKVYCENAIEVLKQILIIDDIDENIKIECIKPPIYRFVIKCEIDDEQYDLINKYIEEHEENIKNETVKQCDFIKIGNEINIEPLNKFIHLLQDKIKMKNKNKEICFELLNKFLVKEKEITVKPYYNYNE